MPEPSPFADEILNARPYAFLDDAPLEERRAHAVQTRRPAGADARDIGVLDAAAIARVVGEERPDPHDADELHDALLTTGYLLEDEADTAMLGTLAAAKRATRVAIVGIGLRTGLWAAAERLPEVLAVHPGATLAPHIAAPASRAARAWTREEALQALLRDRLSIAGPVTAAALAESLAVAEADAEAALLALEADGVVLRGHFSPAVPRAPLRLEWCDRRLLARIHRYTIGRLRAEIAPVTQAEFMRFLFAWQHVEPSAVLIGPDGVRAVVAQLDGVELPARAWERDVLPARVDRYDPSSLDMLCLTGQVGWARLSTGPTQVVGATPIALFVREHADTWLSLRPQVSRPQVSRLKAAPTTPDETSTTTSAGPAHEDVEAGAQEDVGAGAQEDVGAGAHEDVGAGLSRPGGPRGEAIFERLRTHGASFVHDLAAACAMSVDAVNAALAELVAAGLVSSDGFAGLRSMIGGGAASRPESAGRWFAVCLPSPDGSDETGTASASRAAAVEALAWTLLRRYGVVFRRLLTREAAGVPWRELASTCRRLEARGEIRGGRFVAGFSGEQFALPDAVQRLREVRRTPPDDRFITISAADPLNLAGIITPGDRIRVAAGNRIVYRNGVPLAAMEGDMLRAFGSHDPEIAAQAAAAAAGRRVPVISGYVGRIG